MPFFLLVLALGTFAIGTEGYLVAGLLPSVAADMRVTEGVAGQLVTLFALTYAISAPLLATATARMERKRVLLAALLLFVLANLAAALAPSAIWLFGTRILAAIAAAVYTPTAMATAAQLVAARLRGRAIATIMAGSTGALVLGLPLGSWVGTLFGWRASFGMVALLSALSALLLALLLPRVQQSASVITWRQRVALLVKWHVVLALLLSFVSLVGANSLLTYIRPLLDRLTSFDTTALSLVLFGIGAAALAGNLMGGYIADRWGIGRTMISVYASLVVITPGISLLMLLPRSASLNVIAVGVLVIWSLASWLGAPALNTYLTTLEPRATTVVLSLNMSALYLGIAGAGAMGGLILNVWGIAYLGAVCSVLMLLALGLALFSTRQAGKAAGVQEEPGTPPAVQEEYPVRL
jgi:predicted MFS family arabinose efflux permease